MASTKDVISFEVLRNLRKKTFWYASLLPPVILVVVFSISHASSNKATNDSLQQAATATQSSTIAILDETKLINTQLLANEHITTESTKQDGINAVQNGSITAFIYYPKDVPNADIQIYAQDKGITNATPYNPLATSLLRTSTIDKASTAIHDSRVVELLQKNPAIATTTYKNGKQTNNEADVIAPGVFLLAFLAIVMLQTYLMVTSTTEEKENRAAEILLTSIQSSRLITGKILSMFVLGLVQLLAIIIPLLVAYMALRHHVTLPGGVSLSHIPLNFRAVMFGLLFFVAGVVLFTGVMVGAGSLFPSAQDAGRYVGLFILWAYIPIYAIGYILSSSNNPIVTVFTYFPLTAPTTVLIRNAIGTVSVGQSALSLAIIIVSAFLAILFAMKAFRYSAMEYGRRVSVKEILNSHLR